MTRQRFFPLPNITFEQTFFREENRLSSHEEPSPSRFKGQDSYSTESPVHGLPPLRGTGSLQVLVLCLRTTHDLTEHWLHCPHSLQLPWTTPDCCQASTPSQPTLVSTETLSAGLGVVFVYFQLSNIILPVQKKHCMLHWTLLSRYIS